MLPTVFGAAVYQVNIFMSTLLASLLPEGSVSYLYYADRLVQFPLGIFAIAIATAVLPTLSRQVAQNNYDEVGKTFGHAMRLVFFITFPAVAGLIILREPIVALLFRRGAFDIVTTRLTADALLYYSIGLWAFSGVRIVVSMFYALHDTATPVKTAAVSVAANVCFGILLMKPLGHCGLALATSLASMINLAILIGFLISRLGHFNWRSIIISTLRSIFFSVLMAGAVFAAANLIVPNLSTGVFTLLGGVLGSIVIGILVYAGLNALAKSPEFEDLVSIIGKRKKGR
jgi:putative peptidoglycan lipid II flippase